MNKREIKSWTVKIERQKKRIADERDKLRDMVSELEGVLESCDRAIDHMTDAADALSELL